MDEEAINIIKRKGGEVLLHKGHQYYKHREYANSGTRWVCSRKRKYKCSGAITVQDNKIQKSTDHKVEGNLTCLPDDAKNTVDLVMDEIKEKAAITAEPVPKIYNELMAPLYDKGYDKVTKIPSYANSKTAIYTRRKKEYQVQKLVYNEVTEVEIPAKFSNFILGEETYIIEEENGEKEARIIVFSAKEGKELLNTVDEFYGDGTFKSTPAPFTQLLTIHANIGSGLETTNIVPVAYALMNDKSENSYAVLYKIIKEHCPNWEPKLFHCDFETSCATALKNIFPNVIIKRCYYHFINSLWRKAKALALKAKLYRRIVGLCTALPLLPEAEIQNGWEYIQNQCAEMEKMKSFMTYMESYWLKNADFVREWCIYNQLHRTNNFAEGWHARLNRAINKNYVTIPKLLYILEEDVSINKMKISNVESGQHTNKRSKLQKQRDAFILNAQLQLVHKEITVGHFLEQHR